jgi:hypothetical protein
MVETSPFQSLRLTAALGVALALGSGCTSVVFDEKTDGMDLPAYVDDVFSISLPRTPGRNGLERFDPEIQGRSVKMTARGQDETGSREWFKFEAVQAGDSEIRISGIPVSDLSPVRQYRVKVNVRRWEW